MPLNRIVKYHIAHRLALKVRVVICLIFIFVAAQACQHSNEAQTEHITKTVQVPNHPRLLLKSNEEENLKKNVTDDSTWSAIHRIIIHECNEMLSTSPIEYKLDGFRLLEQSRKCKKRVMYLSYAWRMTHDKKYLDRLEKELLTVSSFTDWNPSHFLDVAEMTMAVAVGFDWLYNDLSKSSLAIIKNAIIKKGLEPSLQSEYNAWLKESNNWNQVCNAGMIYGALAVYEEQPELSRRIINRSMESIQIPMKEYDPDGAYAEGYEYWRYGTTYNVYLIDALEKVFGSSFGLMNNSGFAKTATYLKNMVGPNGMNFNYSDCSSTSWLNPAMFWFANRQKDHSVLYSEKVISIDKEKLSGVRDLPTVLIWGAGLDFKNVSKPHELIWSGLGKNPVALMRNSWTPDAIYIGLKGGSPANPHGHMDVGSFVMDAMGERWAMDFGLQDYRSLESKGIHIWDLDQKSQRWQVFRYSNLAHNTLSFNNKLQQVKGHASIKSTTYGKDFLSAVVDLTEVYNDNVSKALRGAAIVNGEYAVIKDEIELTESSAIRWRMVTPAPVKIINKNTAELIQNNKRVILKVQEPSDVTLETWSAKPPHDYDEANPNTSFVGFEVKSETKGKINLTVLLIPQGTVRITEKTVPPLAEWKDHK
jgi:hypothetical protein